MIKVDKSDLLALGIAFLCLMIRLLFFDWIYFEPLLNNWLPESFDRRALAIVEGKKVFYLTGWASYPLFLALFYKLLKFLNLISERFYWTGVLNASLGSISAYLLAQIMKQLFPGRLILSACIGFLYILYYPAIYFSALNLSENFFTPLFMALIWFVILYQAKPDWKLGLITGLLSGIAVAIRPLLLSFLPLLILWLAFPWKKKLYLTSTQFVPAFLVSILSILLGVSFINSKIDFKGNFNFSGNSGINATLAWCEPSKISYHAPDGSSFWFRPPVFKNDRKNYPEMRTAVPFERADYYYMLAWNCIKQKPSRLISNLGHSLNIFEGYFYPDFDVWEAHGGIIKFWKFLTLLFLAFMLVYPWLDPEGLRNWCLGIFILFSLVAVVYLSNPGEERYLAPYHFVLLIWGVRGLSLFARGLLPPQKT
ncbi:MAG: hypothetical protein SFT81_01715 [Candidatus Caenarcaniphilales bacterium]|nr:hypothetical protein [Candidatus Caenarcaniphilales bacterium]